MEDRENVYQTKEEKAEIKFAPNQRGAGRDGCYL
jgi:hypothetical protein